MKTIFTLIFILMSNPSFGEFFQDISGSIKNNQINVYRIASHFWDVSKSAEALHNLNNGRLKNCKILVVCAI